MKKQNRQAIEKKVKEILSEKLGTALDEITPDADISKDLGADSLDFAELIMELQEAFRIELPLVDAEGPESEEVCKVDGLVNLIMARVA